MSSSSEKTTESPLYSPSIFIGRDEEISIFWELLDNPEKRILHIEAPGGMGKTKLLEELLFNQLPKLPRDKTAIYPNQLIDLYHTNYQIELGILTTIANQFPSSFASFIKKVDEYYETKQNHEQLRASFIECYSLLKANYIILFFDTLEIINESIKEFFTKVFPVLLEKQPNTFIVTAGRKKFPIKTIEDKVSNLELTGFEKEDILKYFEHNEIKPLIENSIDESIKEKLLSRIFELSNGKPILIALTVDWIHNDKFTEDLLYISKEDFEKELVERVNELSEIENSVILAMCHFHKRFDENILMALFPTQVNNITLANDLIAKLRRFSFVKYRKLKSVDDKETQSFLLHDEMRKLVKTYIISRRDGDGSFFKDWTSSIINYYNKFIDTIDALLKKEYKDDLKQELHNLQQEKLYYFCIYDFDSAFNYYLKLRESLREESWDVRQRFLDVLDEYKSQMKLEQFYQYSLYSSYTFYDRNQYEEYLKKADEILSTIGEFSSDSVMYECQAKTICKKIQALTNAGQINEAINFGEQHHYFLAEKEQLGIRLQYGHFLSAMGYAFRRQGDKQKPKQYYEHAITCYSTCDTDKKNIYLASAEVNLAFIEHLSGQDIRAIARCKQALKRLKIDHNIQWRANNVLGIIEADCQRGNEAQRYFDKALYHAKEAKNNRGIALICTAQARMYRQQGWYKVFDRKNFEPALADYEKAGDLLEKAISILITEKASPDLAEAYTEKGLLLREQGKFDDALNFFSKSDALANQHNNVYLLADNLQRMAVTYFCSEKNEQAKNTAKKAIELAIPLTGLHIMARAEKVLADIAYQEQKYDDAFNYAYNSIIHHLQIDANSQDDSAPKKARLYNKACDWLTEELLDKLPSVEENQKYREQMRKKWEDLEGDSSGIDKDKWLFDSMI